MTVTSWQHTTIQFNHTRLPCLPFICIQGSLATHGTASRSGAGSKARRDSPSSPGPYDHDDTAGVPDRAPTPPPGATAFPSAAGTTGKGTHLATDPNHPEVGEAAVSELVDSIFSKLVARGAGRVTASSTAKAVPAAGTAALAASGAALAAAGAGADAHLVAAPPAAHAALQTDAAAPCLSAADVDDDAVSRLVGAACSKILAAEAEGQAAFGAPASCASRALGIQAGAQLKPRASSASAASAASPAPAAPAAYTASAAYTAAVGAAGAMAAAVGSTVLSLLGVGPAAAGAARPPEDSESASRPVAPSKDKKPSFMARQFQGPTWRSFKEPVSNRVVVKGSQRGVLLCRRMAVYFCFMVNTRYRWDAMVCPTNPSKSC